MSSTDPAYRALDIVHPSGVFRCDVMQLMHSLSFPSLLRLPVLPPMDTGGDISTDGSPAASSFTALPMPPSPGGLLNAWAGGAGGGPLGRWHPTKPKAVPRRHIPHARNFFPHRLSNRASCTRIIMGKPFILNKYLGVETRLYLAIEAFPSIGMATRSGVMAGARLSRGARVPRSRRWPAMKRPRWKRILEVRRHSGGSGPTPPTPTLL